ncbi:MAG: 7TM diverse intracellular signaling domain-containing protein, partial [Myxococcota bacterium]
EHHALGDQRPFDSRPIAHPTYAIPLGTGSHAVLMHARSSGSLAVPMTRWSPAAFERHRLDLGFGLALCYAFILALALYNAFLAVSLRSAAYGTYTVWLLGVGLSQMGFSGHAAMYLWPESTWLSNAAPTVFLAVSAGAGCAFVRTMLELPTLAPRTARAMQVLLAAWCVVAPALLLNYSLAVLSVPPLGALTIVAIISAVVGGVRRRQRVAYFLALGAACFLPSYGAFGLASQGLLPVNFWTQHALKIGICVEALILALALADRVRGLEKERVDAANARMMGLIHGQDEERRRIASELHDGVSQTLGTLARSLDGKPAEAARACAREVRRIAHNLHPDELQRLGLSAASRRVVEQAFDSAGLEYDHEIENVDAHLGPKTALHVFRILQECLNNVVRHAEAAQATVRLVLRDGAVELRITDDGQGIGNAAHGLGLNSIRTRAEAAGAELWLRSTDAGTEVEVLIPQGDAR